MDSQMRHWLAGHRAGAGPRFIGLLAVVGVLGWSAWDVAGARASPARPSSSPAAFALTVVRFVVANDYADAWRTLVRTEKASIPRALYVACERQTPIPGHLSRVRVMHLQQTSLAVPGRSRPALGYTVTVRTTIAVPGGDSITTQMTIPVVPDAGGYAWILRAERFAAYRRGHCFQQAPPA
jgi:hypothetical protein